MFSKDLWSLAFYKKGLVNNDLQNKILKNEKMNSGSGDGLFEFNIKIVKWVYFFLLGGFSLSW